MTRADQWERVAALFRSLKVVPADQRGAYLDEHCDDDPDLRAEVESLLEQHDHSQSFLDPAHLEPAAIVGEHIGRYRITSVIGRGGMGIVFGAEQDEPERTVALKLLRYGVASAQAMRRFHHEVEMLGRLEHPNIARIHDAGTFDDGAGAQPYFVMELIRGVSLIEYAKARALGVRERIELFLPVCDAVHHAHQKGIIHRDLKPTNILVDPSATPKIIDFGVARATDSDLHTTTLRTEIGQLIGTVPYMSPDQVAGDPGEVDIRSDVYSLGVILYELLAETLPYDLKTRTIPEAVRIIQEEDPIPLSSISRAFHGDLETIVARALEKDKARRYQSAADLAADLRRHLRDEPILARPASALYQMRKFARRNRALVAGLVAAAVLLLAGSATTAWQWLKVEEEAKRSGMINAYLMDVLALRKPHEDAAEVFQVVAAGGQAISAEELIDRASRRLDEVLGRYPIDRADLHFRFSRTYYGLNRRPESLEHARKAYVLRAEALGEDHPETYEAQGWYGLCLATESYWDEALDELRPAADGLERTFGPNDTRTLSAQCLIGHSLCRMGRHDEGEPILEESWARARDALGTDHRTTIQNLCNYGNHLIAVQKYAEAANAMGSGLDGALSRPKGEIQTAWLLESLARALGEQGERAEALEIYRIGYDWTHREGDPGVTVEALRATFTMCGLLEDMGEGDEALRTSRDTYETCRRELGVHHHTLWAAFVLSAQLRRYGEIEEALRVLKPALEAHRAELGGDDSFVAPARIELARILVVRGEVEEALSLYRLAIDEVGGSRHAYFIEETVNELATLLARRGRHAEVEQLRWEHLTRLRTESDSNERTLRAINQMAWLLKDAGREKLAQAQILAEEAIETHRQMHGIRDERTLNARDTLGVILLRQGKLEEAEALLRDLAATSLAEFSDAHWLTAITRAHHGQSLVRLGRHDDAEPLLLEAYPVLRKAYGERADETQAALRSLIELYDATGQTGRADEYRPFLIGDLNE